MNPPGAGPQGGSVNQSASGDLGGPGNPGNAGPFPPHYPADLNILLNSILAAAPLPPGPAPPPVFGPPPPPPADPGYVLNLYAPASPIDTVPPLISEFTGVCCERHKPKRSKFKLPSHVNFKGFPPEIREHIYSYILPQSFRLCMPPFILALRSAGPTIYHEALAYFSKHNTFRLSSDNTWSPHDMGKVAVKSVEKLKVEFGGLLVHRQMQLYPMIGPDDRILRPFNPKEIWLDATHVPWELIPLPDMLASPCFDVFANLERLLITVPHPNIVPHPEDITNMWDDDFEDIRDLHRRLQRSVRFLNLVLGVRAKLWAVSIGNPDTWYWQAPRGKKLVWNMEKAKKLKEKQRIRDAFTYEDDDHNAMNMIGLNHLLQHHLHGVHAHIHPIPPGGALPPGIPIPFPPGFLPPDIPVYTNTTQASVPGSPAHPFAAAPPAPNAAASGSATTTASSQLENTTTDTNASQVLYSASETAANPSAQESTQNQSSNEWETESESHDMSGDDYDDDYDTDEIDMDYWNDVPDPATFWGAGAGAGLSREELDDLDLD